jgi:hypothetical protein
MWAMIVKEFRQLRRDRRTLAMMIVMPVILLIVFGYAASFDVTTIPTVAAGPEAGQVSHLVGEPFHVTATEPSEGRAWAEEQLRDGNAAVAVVTGSGRPQVLIDGSQLFTAKAAIAELSAAAAKAAVRGSAAGGQVSPPGSQPQPVVTVLYNPELNTSDIMIPGLAGAGVLVTTHYMDEAGECDRLVIMAAGRVVARGTAQEITGDTRISVVAAASWAAAFAALEAAGLPVALVGRTLRVPGAPPDAVRRALGDLPAAVTSAPATLEERFFELTLSSGQTEGHRDRRP